MIKKESNGITYYCFEPSEKESQKAFERALISEDAVGTLVKALLEAMAEAECAKKEAWESVRMMLPEPYNDGKPVEMEYNWILKGFIIRERK